MTLGEGQGVGGVDRLVLAAAFAPDHLRLVDRRVPPVGDEEVVVAPRVIVAPDGEVRLHHRAGAAHRHVQRGDGAGGVGHAVEVRPHRLVGPLLLLVPRDGAAGHHVVRLLVVDVGPVDRSVQVPRHPSHVGAEVVHVRLDGRRAVAVVLALGVELRVVVVGLAQRRELGHVVCLGVGEVDPGLEAVLVVMAEIVRLVVGAAEERGHVPLLEVNAAGVGRGAGVLVPAAATAGDHQPRQAHET